jgi:CTP synthase
MISDDLKSKISLQCDVPIEAVVSAIDADNIYQIPLVLHEEGLDRYILRLLQFDESAHPIDLSGWERLVHQVEAATRPVRIGIIGKYVDLPDAYLSVVESLRHAGFHHGAKVQIEWIQAATVPDLLEHDGLRAFDGLIIPGGFGERGVEGKIAAAQFAREHELPLLGLCLGLQVMIIEVARSLAHLDGANSREFDAITPHPVVDLMDDQSDVVDKGGTMRLGSYSARLLPGSQVARAYGTEVVSERHRHRYEVNPRYRSRLEEVGLVCSGMSPDGRLVEFIELPDHPFWVGTQAHPEFKSRPDAPHPLFRELVGAALARAEGRDPRLIDLGAVG